MLFEREIFFFFYPVLVHGQVEITKSNLYAYKRLEEQRYKLPKYK